MRTIALDTETCLIERGRQAPPLVCVSLAHASGRELLHWSRAFEPVRDLLRDPCVLIVGHNIAYDLAVLIAHDRRLVAPVLEALEAGRITDTMIRAKLIDIAKGERRPSYSLASVAGKKMDKGDDGWRLRYGELRFVDLQEWPDRAKAYALDDASTTLDVFDAQEVEVWCLADQYRRTRAAFALRLVSAYGLHTDVQAVAALRREVEAELAAKRALLRSAGLLRADRVNTKGRLVKGTKDRKTALERAGGGSLKAGDLRELDDPALVAWSDVTTLETMIAKDLRVFAEPPIHSFFDVLKETGRTGSSGPNVQNVRKAKGFRECFIPRAGFVYVDADYSGLELATLAEICVEEFGSSSLADELRAGISPHDATAADILGCSVEYVQANKKDQRVYDARQLAKAENFGLPGGLGAERFAAWAKAQYGIEITPAEAKARKPRWLAKRPEMRLYFDAVSRIVDSGEPLRHLYSDRYRGGCSYTQACNSPFQGLGADVSLDALFRVVKAQLVGDLRGCHAVNFVHDEILIEAPRDQCHEAAEALAGHMVAAGRAWLRHVPLGVEVEAMLRWSKSARPAHDANGRLIPWDG